MNEGGRYLTEIREQDGLLRARVYEATDAERRTVALVAVVPGTAGAAALRELLRLTLEVGFGVSID